MNMPSVDLQTLLCSVLLPISLTVMLVETHSAYELIPTEQTLKSQSFQFWMLFQCSRKRVGNIRNATKIIHESKIGEFLSVVGVWNLGLV